MVRKSTIKFYGRFMLLYAGMLFTILVLLFMHGDFALLLNESATANDPSLMQTIYFYAYKIVLNIPFGFINWFSEKYLWSTLIFVLPDSIFMAWLLAKLYPSEKKNINKVIYYILIGLGLVNFFTITLGLIQGATFL